MSNLAQNWTQAKANFFKTKLPTAAFPPEFLINLNKGADFGPSLRTFDKAANYDARRKAIAAVLKAKDQYDQDIRRAIQQTKLPAAQAALKSLHGEVLTIWQLAETLSQPPRPKGSLVEFTALRNFNLAAGLKPKYLDVKATQVEVIIRIDETLKNLIAAGQESLKIEHLGDVAKKELDKVKESFTATIQDIEANIERDALNETARRKKVQEANEVLKHYARIVEDNIDRAVQSEWQAYLSRRQHLRDFRIKSVAKITLGVIGIGVAAASIALTFGALWMNALAIAKTLADVANNIRTFAQELDEVYKTLLQDIANVEALNRKRDHAKQKLHGQKASKAKEAVKELTNALFPFTKPLIKSASQSVDRARQLLGLVAKLESKADELTGQLNALRKQMSTLPEKHMTPDLRKIAGDMEKSFDKLFAEISDLHRATQNCARFGNAALKAATKLVNEDSWLWGITPEQVGGTTSKSIAAYAVANFIFECAKNGKMLIPI